MKRSFVLFALLLIMIGASAYDFEKDGIYYSITSVEDKAVSVTNSGTIVGSYGILSGKHYIGDVIIPESVCFSDQQFFVRGIAENAFYESEITSIVLPNTLRRISSCAFQDCKKLKSVTIPESVTQILGPAFVGCTSLTEATIVDSETPLGISVINMSDGIFRLCPLKRLYIGRNIRRITSYEDNGIHINDSSDSPFGFFEMIGNSLEVILSNNVTEISDNMFCGARFYNLAIPASVTSIGKSAFFSCPNLEEVNLPDGVTEIREGTFRCCYNLKTIKLGCNVISIGNMAFEDCNNLVSIEIGNGLKSIGMQAFYGCQSLKEVKLPQSVTNIDSYAFDGCNQLKKVYSGAFYPPKAHDASFSSIAYWLAILYVPYGTKSKYNVADGWKNFNSIEEDLDNIAKFRIDYYVDDIIYKSYEIEYGSQITPEPEPAKEGFSFSGWSDIPATMPANDVIVTGSFTVNNYKLSYIVDGDNYKTIEIEYGAKISPEPAPSKEGYSFSGWSIIPATMPAHDVTVTGSFTINTYKLTYMVDGEVYKTKNLEYGAKIPVEPNPSKEGYTFSGWDSVPSIMPAHDVTVKGTFAINKYKLTYLMNGELFKEYLVEYQAKMPVPEIPYDDGYDYSYVYEQLNMVNLRYGGVMPAWDVTVDLFLYPRSFKLTYMLDGKEYKVVNQLYDTEITPEPAPEKEGYSFSGWEGLPERMPAKDVTATGTMTVNKYKLTYVIDGEVYKTLTLEYGATVTIEPNPTKEGHTFMGRSNLPQIMPAHDVTVTGSFTVNKYVLTYLLDGMLYKTLEVDYGSTIIPEPAPERDGYSFSGWIGLPETMPAHMVIVTGIFTSGIVTLEQLPQGSYRIYNPDGKLLEKPRKGLNIVVMADGTVKKLVVKEKE